MVNSIPISSSLGRTVLFYILCYRNIFSTYTYCFYNYYQKLLMNLEIMLTFSETLLRGHVQHTYNSLIFHLLTGLPRYSKGTFSFVPRSLSVSGFIFP